MPIIPIIKSVTNFKQGYIPVINKVKKASWIKCITYLNDTIYNFPSEYYHVSVKDNNFGSNIMFKCSSRQQVVNFTHFFHQLPEHENISYHHHI